MHELFVAAGLRNFQDRPAEPLLLERLAYERPDLIAAAFFESKTNHVDNWSAARIRWRGRNCANLPVALKSSWTSCGGWFLLDAVEALATAGEKHAMIGGVHPACRSGGCVGPFGGAGSVPLPLDRVLAALRISIKSG